VNEEPFRRVVQPLDLAGTTYVAFPVVVDGLLVTSLGAPRDWRWMREFLEVLDQSQGGARSRPTFVLCTFHFALGIEQVEAGASPGTVSTSGTAATVARRSV
jgi:hypothetical protein